MSVILKVDEGVQREMEQSHYRFAVSENGG